MDLLEGPLKVDILPLIHYFCPVVMAKIIHPNGGRPLWHLGNWCWQKYSFLHWVFANTLSPNVTSPNDVLMTFLLLVPKYLFPVFPVPLLLLKWPGSLGIKNKQNAFLHPLREQRALWERRSCQIWNAEWRLIVKGHQLNMIDNGLILFLWSYFFFPPL